MYQNKTNIFKIKFIVNKNAKNKNKFYLLF